MKIKYNYFFIPVLIILIVAFYYVTNREQDQEASRLLADRTHLNFDTLDVIEITNNDVTIRLEKDNAPDVEGFGSAENWRMVEPINAGCNPETLAAVLEGLKNIKAERDLPEITPEQLTEFGLEQPSIRVMLASASSDEVMMDLALGHENSAGTSRYGLLENSGNAFLVPIYDVEPFEIDADSIRDQRALNFDTENIDSVSLSSAQGEIVLEKIDDEWKVTTPIFFNASPARIDVLFHDLTVLQAVEFIPDKESDPQFNTTNVDVKLAGSGRNVANLTIYGEDISRGYFAESSWQPTPFIVEAYIYDRLAVTPEVFYYTVMIDIDPSRMKTIVLRQPGSDNIELERSGETWTVVKPEDSSITDNSVFDKFIETVVAFKPYSTVPDDITPEDMGLSPSFLLKLEVYAQDGKEKTLKLGGLDEYGYYYATQDDSLYVTVAPELVDAFMEAADRIR